MERNLKFAESVPGTGSSARFLNDLFSLHSGFLVDHYQTPASKRVHPRGGGDVIEDPIIICVPLICERPLKAPEMVKEDQR